jgi:ABC-type bacteriocin/lantibiotic exporter with double-glycine peptidase domain
LFFPIHFNRKIEVKDKRWAESSQGIFERLQEVFGNIKLIKYFDTHKIHINERLIDLKNSFKIYFDKLRLELKLQISSLLLNKFFWGALVLYCSYGVFSQKLSVGTLSAIVLYLGQLFQIHNSFLNFLYSVPQFLVSSKRLEHITEMGLIAKTEIIKNNQERIFQDIRFDRVSFQYKDRPLLFCEISFKVKSGSTMGLVGLSGSGKSTMINLILGLLNPTSGSVLIDGIDVRSTDGSFFHEYVAVVPQELFLWNASIADNISYGLKDVPITKIKEVARLTCLDDFIETLKNKYDTVIGEDACRLSQGQKQRLTIARAVIRDPRVLLLDEATAHLDTKNEKEIFNNLRKHLSKTTIIFVSHSQALLEMADKICFLHNKNLVESVSHRELLIKNRDYAGVNNFLI